jgi:hypothetical protein
VIALICCHSLLIDFFTSSLPLQLHEVEEHKLLLLEFISQNDLRIPRALRAKLDRVGGVDAHPVSSTRGATPNRGAGRNGGSTTTSSQHPRYAGEKGYVEEVDVQVI